MDNKILEIFIPGPAGRLEAKYFKSKKNTSPIALVLQPHPQYGGTMNNKVVVDTFNTFMENDFSVCRVNFRGVGKSDGSVVNPKGINIQELREYIFKNGGVKDFKGFVSKGAEILEEDADILIPAAMELVINKGNAEKIKTPLIIEAANGPVSSEADEILSKKGVVIIPDLYANAGGVTVSYFEWIKNLSRIRLGRLQRRAQENQTTLMIEALEKMIGSKFPDEYKELVMQGSAEIDLVRSGLEDTMRNTYNVISNVWNNNPNAIDLRTSAMMVSVKRVMDSYHSLGL